MSEDIFKQLISNEEIMSSIYTKALLEGVCEVVFTKVDGTERTMKCTLNDKYIPEENKPHGDGWQDDSFREHVQAVYDVEKEGWRSFRLDSVKSFRSI